MGGRRPALRGPTDRGKCNRAGPHADPARTRAELESSKSGSDACRACAGGRRGRGGARPPAWRPGHAACGPGSPWRTRNGSATSSTVSRSSPTATASVETPTGPPAEAAAQDVEHGAVEPVQAELVDLVELQRRPGDLQGHHAVGADLGVVADPAQQPVGDPRGAARAGGDLGGALGRSSSTPSRPGGAVHDQVELVGLVELQVGGEAEPVAQRAGQQPGAGGGADQGERRDLQRDRGGARVPCR